MRLKTRGQDAPTYHAVVGNGYATLMSSAQELQWAAPLPCRLTSRRSIDFQPVNGADLQVPPTMDTDVFVWPSSRIIIISLQKVLRLLADCSIPACRCREIDYPPPKKSILPDNIVRAKSIRGWYKVSRGYDNDMDIPPLNSIPFLPISPTPSSTECKNWIYHDTFIEQRTLHYVY